MLINYQRYLKAEPLNTGIWLSAKTEDSSRFSYGSRRYKTPKYNV